MDLNQLSLEAVRDRLVREAGKLGVSIEQHAANELHALEAKYGRATLIAVVCAFVLGFVFGKL